MAEENDKPVFNERVLGKLLEAAYVVQEHIRGRQTPRTRPQESTAEAARPISPPADETPVPVPEPGQPRLVQPGPVQSEPVQLDPIQSEGVRLETPELAPVVSEAPQPEPTLPSPAVSAQPVTEAPLFQAPVPKDDYATTLAKIIETQREIRESGSEVMNPMALIAERVSQAAKSGGAAVAVLHGEVVHYRATAGLMSPPDAEVSSEKALCAPCLQTAQVLRCVDADSSPLVDAAECKRRGIQAMIAVPVFHDGAVAGALELYYAGNQSFTERDVHTAQLMAGLVSEALAREEEVTRRKSLAGERALMLEALERLQPNLAALVDASAIKDSPNKTMATASASPGHSSPTATVCHKCGHELLDEEQFCGKCGSPRGGYEPPSMQSKVASMWHMQEALKKMAEPSGNAAAALPEPAPGFDDAEFEKMLADSLEKEMPELFQSPEERSGRMWPEIPDLTAGFPIEADASKHDASPEESDELSQRAENENENEEEASVTAALAKPERNPDWSSAASAREFLEQLAAERSSGLARFWQARRGDFYLALAVILVAVVIRWGIWSNHSVGATGTPATAAAQHRKPAPDADLSWFDRTLVKFGLAEAPEPVEYKGNPATEVWVDLHTALYYCPGTDLYGKTPKGKFSTQRDAQLDQFEPAYRKACD